MAQYLNAVKGGAGLPSDRSDRGNGRQRRRSLSGLDRALLYCVIALTAGLLVRGGFRPPFRSQKRSASTKLSHGPLLFIIVIWYHRELICCKCEIAQSAPTPERGSATSDEPVLTQSSAPPIAAGLLFYQVALYGASATCRSTRGKLHAKPFSTTAMFRRRSYLWRCW